MKYIKPESIRKRLLEYATRPEPTEVSHGLRGAIVGALNAALEQYDTEGNNIADENRRIVAGWLFTPDAAMPVPFHFADLKPQELHGLKRWIGFEKTGGEWTIRDEFKTEAWWILNRARSDMQACEQALEAGRILTMRELIARWQVVNQGEAITIETERASIILEEMAKMGAVITRRMAETQVCDEEFIY